MLLLSVISIRLLSWGCDAQYIRKESKNVHAFFGYIAKNPKMCTAFSEKFSFTPGIFPKKLKPFSLFSNFSRKSCPPGILPKFGKAFRFSRTCFRKICSHLVYCQKSRKRSRFFRTFLKICPSGIFPEFLKAFRFSRTFFKKILSPLMTIRKSTPKGHTLFQLFAEKFLYPYLPYHRLGVICVPF